MSKTSKPNRGRPAGSRNVRRKSVRNDPSRCRACGSTEREPYSQTTVQEHGGHTAEGQPFTHIVRRWTKCGDCGQARIDLAYENRTTPQPDEPT